MTQATANLVFIDGKSRKFWNAELNGTTVVTQWGRINTDGQTKTAEFADEAKAEAAFAKAVREKQAKGYAGAGSGNLDGVTSAISVPDMRPMLPTEIPEADIDRYVHDHTHALQAKCDGDRVFLTVRDGAVTVLGRGGQQSKHTALFTSGTHAADLARLDDVTLDGELIDGVLHVFDMPECAAANLPSPSGTRITPDTEYSARHAAIGNLFARWRPNPDCFALVDLHVSTEAKRAAFDAFKANNAEGVVIKDLTAPYEPGRRVTTMLKIKFVSEADCVVTAVATGGKDNLELGLYSADGALVPVGAVSAIGKDPCAVGDVVEVRFLYKGTNGQLVQPRVLRRRTDKTATECLLSQLDNKHVNKAAVA